jgi:FAD/FMN-containing dehydrogenase
MLVAEARRATSAMWVGGASKMGDFTGAPLPSVAETACMLDVQKSDTFERQLSGHLVWPDSDGYEEARKVWNGMIDRRPALIVRCQTVEDVVASVNFARANDLLLAVRGGAHNVAGNATCDGGMVIDLSGMKDVDVDPGSRTARAQAGCTWADLDRATHAHGLATTGGLVSSTGIAGFTLGGGVGWLMRKYGLTCDNLRAAEVVAADGSIVSASTAANPELLWGLRGGGGNFGVVTAFEYDLHPVRTVLGGLVLHPASRAAEVLRFFREFVASAPDELTCLAVFLTAPPAPFVPAHLQLQPAIAIAVCYAGDPAEGERVIEPLRTFGPPAADVIGPMPYPALQSMLDDSAPAGLQNYWKSTFLAELTDAALDALLASAAATTSPLSAIHIHHIEGAVNRVAADATAFAHRNSRFVLNIVGTWPDPAESEANIRWVRSTHDAIASNTPVAPYINFMGDETTERVRAAYGPANYDRLVALKRKYDPRNLFRLNQNIRPDE